MTGTDVGWLAGQGVVFVAAFVVLPLTDGLAGQLSVPGTAAAGWVLFALAGGVGVAAMAQLGAQLVPQPSPVAGGELIRSGLYRVVRHPIYTAVLLAVAGAVVRYASIAGLVLLVATGVFFDRKAAHEERLLEAAHPKYREYRRDVPARFIPRVW